MQSREKAIKVRKTAKRQTGLSQINKRAAGIDIGAEQHYVAVPKQGNKDDVRAFGVFTTNLYEIVSG